jgi:putative glutamine amidotransferase
VERLGDRPLIAVVAPLEIRGASAEVARVLDSLAASALRHVARAGADVWLVDVSAPDRPRPADIAAADGVLLLGGGDIDPALYGVDAQVPEVYGVDRAMDEHSFAVVRAAVDAGRPVLGVCRGAQVLNVALGGTLVPHLESPLHRGAFGADLFIDELVDLEPGSWAARVFDRTRVKVRSGHHQAVAEPATGLRAVGLALDGVVECVEAEDMDRWWAVGVQWHPEEVDGDGGDAQALFSGFVAVVRGRRG